MMAGSIEFIQREVKTMKKPQVPLKQNQLHLRIDVDLKHAVEVLAARKRVGVSQMIRSLLIEHLEKNGIKL